jgi:site-specific DNA-methyltransferase (adenine-specific)
VWWNLGDSYANKSSAWGGRGKNSILNNTGLKDKQRRNTIVPEGLKAKDLMMIPARVAIALSENGWYLRSEIIWHKPNPMPESVKDRPTSAHEKIYLFSKNKKYYYDSEAIREEAKTKPTVRNKSAEGYQADYPNGKRFSEGERTYGNGYANKRNVWTVTTKPFKGAHFAVFPTDLIEPCIKAGCPKGGTVLDPFGGSGTTGFVANSLDRNAILIELNEEYVEIAKKRIGGNNPLFSEVEDG